MRIVRRVCCERLDVVVRDTTSVECFLVVLELFCWVVVYMNRPCIFQS